jgi:hypothetical protein
VSQQATTCGELPVIDLGRPGPGGRLQAQLGDGAPAHLELLSILPVTVIGKESTNLQQRGILKEAIRPGTTFITSTGPVR